MNFTKQLNSYMEEAHCTVSALAEISGLSASVISRYKNGKRTPTADSAQLIALSDGLIKIASQNGVQLDNVLETLTKTLSNDTYDTDIFSQKLDELLKALDIHNSEISKNLKYDASFISKIRSGKRKPADIDEFVTNFSSYLFRYCLNENKSEELAYLLDCSHDEISSPQGFLTALSTYLRSSITQHTETFDFLKTLDGFSLSNYIKSIHFDDLKLPSAPFSLPKSKNYYGIEGLKEAELAFLKATVMSKSKEAVFMCSDMPMESLVDESFPKKWMLGLAAILKKGLQINIIHQLDRPFKELMLGLEAWIPLYMTGQVHPYYLKNAGSQIFRHILYVSGDVAMSGECIAGKDTHGKKYVTNNKQELAYYKRRGFDLLNRAQPLIDIYRKEHKKVFSAFLANMQKSINERHNFLSSLSLGTITDEILEDVLSSNNFSDNQKRAIKRLVDAERTSYKNILSKQQIIETVPFLSKEEYKKQPLALPLSALFIEKLAFYTYEQYMAHMKAAREFARANENYHLIENPALDFHNIQIQTICGKLALISKTNSPTIHFVIYHPMLVEAISNLVIPIRE